MEQLIDICGWIGSVMVVTAYFLVSNGKVEAQTYTFQTINVFAALFVGVNAYHYGALPSFGINAVWALIAIAAMLRIKLNNNKKHKET